MVNKLFTFTNIIINIIIILICYFLISEDDISKMKQIINFYQFYNKNKSAKLIKEIKDVNSNQECPSGSSPLLFYKYPGTKAGCLISKTDFEEGSCGIFTKIFHNYEDFEATDEKDFDVLYSKKLCAVPFDNNEYKNYINNGINDKLCGYLDNTKNKFYVESGKGCPINNIIINKENSIEVGKYNTIELIKDQYYLHYSIDYINEESLNNNDYYLLTTESLIISEGYPCINPGEINTYHIQYLLNKANESYICNTFIDDKNLDKRYNLKLSSINKNSLYKDNNINLGGYYSYPFKEANLNLYQLGYIGVDPNFISDILDNSDKFISDINSMSDYNKYNNYIKPFIFSFIFLFIVNLIFKYFIVDITIYILSFILIALDIAYLVLNIFVFFYLSDFETLEQYYSGENNDKTFNAQIKYISDIIDKSKKINLKNIIGICIMIFLIILFDIINCCIFNNPNNRLVKMKNNIDYYSQNKKIYNSINVLKPFEDKKESRLKHKKEIELSKINSINEEDNDNNIINNTKDDEEDILTNE